MTIEIFLKKIRKRVFIVLLKRSDQCSVVVCWFILKRRQKRCRQVGFYVIQGQVPKFGCIVFYIIMLMLLGVYLIGWRLLFLKFVSSLNIFKASSRLNYLLIITAKSLNHKNNILAFFISQIHSRLYSFLSVVTVTVNCGPTDDYCGKREKYI